MKRQFGILAGEEQDMINEKHELTAAQIDAITSTPAQPHNLDARAWCRAAIAADRALNADAGVMRQTVTEEMVTAYLTANWGAHWAWIDFPKDLHPNTADLVIQFAKALAQKLRASELKYGYADGWEDKGWMDECRAKLLQHIAKGDPLDVAAYCAFLWHHGESTTPPAEQQREQEPVAWIDEVGNVFPLTAYRPDGKRASWTDAHKRGWEPIYTHPAPGLSELRAKVEALQSDNQELLAEVRGRDAREHGPHELFEHEDYSVSDDVELTSKVFCRFGLLEDSGDSSVGMPPRSYWALAKDQSGTGLAELLERLKS